MPRSNLLHRLLPKRPKSKGDGEATSADASTSQSTLRVAGHHSERQNGPEQSVTSIQGEPDADKYGLVLLNPLQEHSEPKYDVDVIAIHGLGGSLYKTWTHENGKLWLRDFLPADVPSARVFSFGYNSNVAFSRETGTLRGYARSLLESIRLERVEPEERTRPLIFVCHSMGGIVMKQAFLIAVNEADLFPGFTECVCGVLFLGTPNQGSSTASYAGVLSQIANVAIVGSQMSRWTGPMRTELLHGLETNAPALFNIAQDFRVHASKINTITSFLEQKTMPGKNTLIVDERSGTTGAPHERIVPMPGCDHREVCKHEQKNNHYRSLATAIKDSILMPRTTAPRHQDSAASGGMVDNVLDVGRSFLRVNVPPKRVSHFVSRQELLSEIHRHLGDESSSNTVVLLGMGGAGKTQLALEICRSVEESHGFMAALWIDGSSPASVLQSYEVIAKKISQDHNAGTDGDAIVSYVHDTLRTWTRRWLIVFDNYDNPSAFPGGTIRRYVPSSRCGRFLFTSRHEDSKRLGYSIPTIAMSEEEGLKLLLRRAPLENEIAEGQEIASMLGYLPLALDQAGAYIDARSLRLEEFISHYTKRKAKILQEIPHEWEYQRVVGSETQEKPLNIFTTWELSFEQISGNEDEKMKKDHFLTMAAFFDNNCISEKYLRAYFECGSRIPDWTYELISTEGEWDSDKLGDILAEFQKLSLLHVLDRQADCLQFSLHPVVRDWIRVRKPHETWQMPAGEAIQALGSFLRPYDIADMLFQAVQEISLHMDACVQFYNWLSEGLTHSDWDEVADFASDFLQIYFRQSRWHEAEILSRRALKCCEERLGPGDERTLDMVSFVGWVCENTDQGDEAEACYSRVLAYQESQLGPDHPDTLWALCRAGTAYRRQGRYAEAETALQRALAGIEEQCGPLDPRALWALEQLGFLHKREGRLDEAEALFRRAAAGYEEKLGADDRQTTVAIGRLGRIVLAQQRHDEAEPLLQQALAGFERWYGPEHVDSLTLIRNLVKLNEERGRVDEVERLRRRLEKKRGRPV